MDANADCVPDVGIAPLNPTFVVVPDHEYDVIYELPIETDVVGVPTPTKVVYGPIRFPPGTYPNAGKFTWPALSLHVKNGEYPLFAAVVLKTTNEVPVKRLFILPKRYPAPPKLSED